MSVTVTLEDCRRLLQDVSGPGNRFDARCPCHEDTRASLSLRQDGNTLLVFCHAGCNTKDIFAALRRLQAAEGGGTPRTSSTARSSRRDLGPIEHMYGYVNAEGVLLYCKVRYPQKEFRIGRPDPGDPDRLLWSLKGIHPVLYNLPEVREAIAEERPIFLVEGEKDADTLTGLGYVATCNCDGAGKWRDSYTEALRGAHVVILPDYDTPGLAHAQAVTKALLPVAATVTMLATIHTSVEHSDVSDWFAAGHTAEELEAILDATPPIPPAPTPWDKAKSAFLFATEHQEEMEVFVRDLAIPGCITLLSAPRASGKSFVALFLSVALASGGRFRGERLATKRVLLVDRDNAPAMVRRRMQHLGITATSQLKVLTRTDAPPLTDAQAWSTFPVEDYDLIIFDSLGAATEGVSEKEGSQTQHFLATLKNLAHKGLAILALDNTNKAGANYRGRGEKADAVDILYEVRNVTGWTPSGAGNWWERLPDFGEHTWQERAARRHAQPTMQIAFIPSKFRLAMEPEPFVLDIDMRGADWTLVDITQEIAAAGAKATDDAHAAAARHLRDARRAIVAALQSTPGETLLKGDVENIIMQCSFSRKQARNLLVNDFNSQKNPEGFLTFFTVSGARGRAVHVGLTLEKELGGNNRDIVSPSNGVELQSAISAASHPSTRRKSAPLSPAETLSEKNHVFPPPLFVFGEDDNDIQN
jgi:hypothetical protein